MEVRDAPTWRKSSFSGANGGQCIEVATVPADTILVRDSKDTDGPRLAFGREAWRVVRGDGEAVISS